jgi:hypothetical protein
MTDRTAILRHGELSAEDDEKDVLLMGGNPSNPSWDEYINGFTEEFKPRIIAIKEAIIKNGLLGIAASRACNDCYFEFYDGMRVAFTWRAWGDLMQAIVSKREGYGAYYM